MLISKHKRFYVKEKKCVKSNAFIWVSDQGFQKWKLCVLVLAFGWHKVNFYEESLNGQAPPVQGVLGQHIDELLSTPQQVAEVSCLSVCTGGQVLSLTEFMYLYKRFSFFLRRFIVIWSFIIFFICNSRAWQNEKEIRHFAVESSLEKRIKDYSLFY